MHLCNANVTGLTSPADHIQTGRQRRPTGPQQQQPTRNAAAMAAQQQQQQQQQQQHSLDTLLTACLSFDNQVRKQAEGAVRQLANRPDVVPQLAQQVATAGDPQVRQLAAVLLRKWMARHYAKLTAEVRTRVQQVLLEGLGREPVHSVRRALADCVAATAQQAMPAGQWPSLLGFLHQCSKADVPELREVALLLFAALYEAGGEYLTPHVPAVMQAIAAGSAHPSTLVQTAALAAVEPLLPYVTGALLPAFHQLLAALLPCAQAALAVGNEELLVLICQMLLEVAEQPAPLLTPCMQQVLELVMVVATNRAFEPATREQALHLLHWVARCKPKQLMKSRALLKAIVEALCEMMAEPAPADHDDAQEAHPSKVAANTLDVLSIHLSSGQVFPPAWQFAQAAGASPDPHRRAAAMMVCAVLAEGCSEALRRRLPQVLPLLLAALADPHRDVRGAAAFGLGQFAEYLQPDVSAHYRTVLPGVFAVLQDGDASVQERACYALDAFCEYLEPKEILPYVPQLMEQLLAVLHASRPGVQEMALSAVSSIAAAAQAAFKPYTGRMLPVLHHFMAHSGAEFLQCRCRAVESVGLLVEALGAADPDIAPHLPGMVEVALQGFSSTDSPDLRDYSHGMLGHVAKAMGEGFSPWLPRVVPLAVTSCEQEDGAFADAGSERSSERGDEHGEQQLGDDDSDDSDDAHGHFNVRTGVLDEKVSATAVLGQYAEACPTSFMPFMEQALAVLTHMCDYWHDEARAAAYHSLHQLVLATHTAFPATPGAAPPAAPARAAAPAAAAAGGGGVNALFKVTEPAECSPQLRHVLGLVLPLLTAPVGYDSSKVAVSAAAGALGQLLRRLGQGAVDGGHLQATSAMAQQLLANTAICQQCEDSDDEGGEADDEDAAAADEELLSAAADLLPALAASMGSDGYAPVFLGQHAEPLLGRLRPQAPGGLRAIAAGTAAELAEVLGRRMAGVVGQLLPLLLRELQAEDDMNRQNAAYCTGLLVQAGPEAAGPFMPQLLPALHHLFREQEAPGARDNAVGAVGRILSSMPQALPPLGQVLPVFLAALPLQEDLSETTPAVEPLCRLLLAEQHVQELQAHVPHIVSVFGQVAAQAEAPAEARVMVARTLATLSAQHPSLASLLAQLPHEQQVALQRLAGGVV